MYSAAPPADWAVPLRIRVNIGIISIKGHSKLTKNIASPKRGFNDFLWTVLKK